MEATVLIIRNSKHEVLLLNRNFEPFGYGLPGGVIEDDEKPLQAIIREVKEEINLDLSKYVDQIHFRGHADSYKGYDIFVFELTVPISNDFRILLNDEHSDYIFTSDYSTITLAGNTENFLELL